MRINTAGSVGYGTVEVSIDGVVPATLSGVTAGNVHWLSTTEIAYQNVTAGPIVQSYNTGTTALTTLSATGANDIGAGNSVWAKWLSSSGVTTSIAGLGPFPAAGLADVGEDGSIGLFVDRATGSGLRVYDSTGSLTGSLSVQIGLPAVSMRSGVLAYNDASGWHLSTYAAVSVAFAPRTGATVSIVLPVVQGSSVYVLELLGTGLTLRNATSGTGWTITTANTFSPDARFIATDVVRVCWSTTTGEGPTRLRLVDLNISTSQMRTGSAAGGSGIVWAAWAPIATGQLPVGPIQGGGLSSGTSLLAPLRTALLQPGTPLISKPWADWAIRVSGKAGGPVDLSNVTGVLGVENGGTGTGTGGAGGQTVTPMQVQFSDDERLLGRGQGFGAGDGQEITLGTGLSMAGTVLSSTGGAGGVGVPGLDGADGEDGFVLPGLPGPQGATGATGATGPAGVGAMGLDGADGEDGWPIPGPVGPQGPAGTGGSGSITASGYTQNADRLLGRTTAGSGAIEEITVGTGLSLAAGSLTATGGGGGAWTLLEQHTASSSASLDFTTWYASTYDEYVIELVGIVPATNNVTAQIRFSTDGGSTYDSGANYAGTRFVTTTAGSTSAGGGTGETSVVVTPNVTNTSTAGLKGTFRLYSPGSTALYKTIFGHTHDLDFGGSYCFWQVSSIYTVTTAVDAFQFLFSSGNVGSGTIRVYGLEK